MWSLGEKWECDKVMEDKEKVIDILYIGLVGTW